MRKTWRAMTMDEQLLGTGWCVDRHTAMEIAEEYTNRTGLPAVLLAIEKEYRLPVQPQGMWSDRLERP